MFLGAGLAAVLVTVLGAAAFFAVDGLRAGAFLTGAFLAFFDEAFFGVFFLAMTRPVAFATTILSHRAWTLE
jgi:hypothetical protein